MPRLRELLTRRGAEDRARVERAYELAREAHHGVYRKSGEEYITHPVAVATLLAELGMDTDSVIAGLLHDTVEDTDVTFEQIEERFGEDVRRIVEGETKVSKLARLGNLQDAQAENLRQMLVAMTGDLRVIVVKLADRLHNMRTLGSMRPDKQLRIARETMDIFAPLAHRLSIGQFKQELENLSFQYLEPEAHAELSQRLRVSEADRDAQVQDASAALRAALLADPELQEWIEDLEISGRSKHLYSIHQKMRQENKALDQIFDLLALRVILWPRALEHADAGAREKAEGLREMRVCYHSLGVTHGLWTPIPGRFKDYVAVPKSNGYQSLHTTVISPYGYPIEVQIRSQRMHEMAEYGVAAHWLYKAEGKEGARSARAARQWLEQLQDLQRDITDASDFIDAVKSDLLSERVFVLTPRGDALSLARGSTPVDFAYQIHTRVGDTAVGARVNGSIVPLSYALQNGDMVEILTNKNSSPKQGWLDFVKTRSARTHIRHHFRQRERQETLQHGHNLLERYLRKRKLPARQLMRTTLLEDAAERLMGSRNPDDLYLALHAGKVTPGAVATQLTPHYARPEEVLPKRRVQKPPPTAAVYVDGLSAPTKLASCCKPVRGDQIMGYLTRGRGVTVHRTDCPNLLRLLQTEPERCVGAGWTQNEIGFAVKLRAVATDRDGLLSDVLALIASRGLKLLSIQARVRGQEAHIDFGVQVSGGRELHEVAAAVGAVGGVREVLRQAGQRYVPLGADA